ncbi:MAG: flagellar basal-body rod protein FlgG [Pseudomonadota bacterium]|nr:flagellar basal-body rod protein FlgG [Pseudomonadota bacterium]
MNGALWVSKTGLSAQDTALRMVSNNLANVSTVGFKRDRGVFEDLLYQVNRQPGGLSTQASELPSGLQLGTGVRTAGSQKIFTQGTLQVTEQSLDLAINGRGFFQVLLADGSIGYTRNGQLHMNANGDMVTADGRLLEPAITIPENARTVTIGDDGTVSAMLASDTSPTVLGNIQLADFVNPGGLEAMGDNLFRETGASGPAQVGTPGLDGLGVVRQGALENSNVSVVEELVNMITTQRAYEMNSKVISTADEMLGYVNQTL